MNVKRITTKLLLQRLELLEKRVAELEKFPQWNYIQVPSNPSSTVTQTKPIGECVPSVWIINK